MRGVQLDEPTTPITKEWNQDIDKLVRDLSAPKLVDNSHSKSLEIEPSSVSLQGELMRFPLTDLSKAMKDKCSVSAEKVKDKPSDKNWRARIMQRKGSPGKYNSCDIDEGVELSIDSTSSSSGLKENKVTFHCDSSPETSDLDHSDTKSNDSRSAHVKKEKESKRRRFKKMITRPLRRSHSAGCEKDIPVHALFLDPEINTDNDSMEKRATDLSLYQHRLFGNDERQREQEQRKVHKTCSADSAMMANSEFMGGNTQSKSKSRNLPFKNMKRKFQFLRRRNTDTALVPKFSLPFQFSVPTYDQALQWSRSFDSLLSDKNGLELFKGFLKSEFSEENLEFWIACEEFRFANDSNIPVLAQKIYGDFVAFQAPKEVNLDSNTRMVTVNNLENPSKEAFELAQHKIQALMEKDSYPRFIESDLYQHILESISKV